MNEMNDQKRLQLADNSILMLEEKIKNQSHLSETASAPKASPVAVIGAACRFPGAVDGTESLWESLQNNVNVIKEIPGSRWDLQKIFSENKNEPNKTYCRRSGPAVPDSQDTDNAVCRTVPCGMPAVPILRGGVQDAYDLRSA